MHRIVRVQYSPDLVLPRLQEAVEIGSDDRDFHEFVGVGKGRHRGAGEHRRFKPVTAGGTIFNHQMRQPFSNEIEESIGAFDLFA
jgi:hypothetical protein